MPNNVETALAARGFSPGAALEFTDGAGTIVRVRSRIGGTRDLRASALDLAERAATKDVREAWLVVTEHRMPDSIAESWRSTLALLRPAIAEKLRLIAVGGGVVTTVPEDERLQDIGREVASSAEPPRTAPKHDSYFLVLHVLLARWLLKQGPVGIGELGETARLSQPTVRVALRRLGRELQRDSLRRVELASFPRRAWSEMVALAPRIRDSHYFEDRSGRPRPPEQLLERLRQRVPTGVALGGVLAARHWDPELDLEGIPRLDLCLDASSHTTLSELVRILDPALQPSDPGEPVSLAVHMIRHRRALFESTGKGVPWADPVDTLLDLEELRLHGQADEMVRRLRASK